MAEAKAEIQEVASNLLSAMSFRFINEIIQLMMENFKQGYLPHMYKVKTLTKISTENVYGIVPFLKAILTTMIPVLIKIREDDLKSVFASAMGSFSKSILIYLGNSEKGTDPMITKKTFSTEISIIYSLLFNVWLEKEPSRFNIPTVEALGYVSNLLPKDKIQEELPKLILGILSLYEKQVGHFSITVCLCQLLEIATKMRHPRLKPLMDNLLNSLHHQICLSGYLNNQLVTKSYTAALDCFTILASIYTDSVINFLFGKLENIDQQVRAGTLNVLRHLICSLSSELEGQKTRIVDAIKPILLESTTNMEKKQVVQVISVMAQQGYLEPEGGEIMVEFLVRQCTTPIDSRTPIASHHTDQATDEDLVSICETVMYIITDIVKMEPVLWPFLLGYVTKTQYSNSLTTICNCITQIAKRKLQTSSDRFVLTYEDNGNLSKAQALLARLLLASCCPYQGGGRGAAALRLLQVLSFSIHPAIMPEWEEQLPSLADYLLEHSEGSLPQQEWEEKLLLFLSRTLNTIDDEGWTSKLSDEMCKQIDTEPCCPQEKAFLYKSLGTVLHQVPSKNIKEELCLMLQSVQHSECIEREGVAIAIGLCAMTHFDDTLASLEEFAQSSRLKNVSNFFNILRDKPDVNGDKVKSTLALCYGNIALYAPQELAVSRIETHILPAVISHFNSCRQGVQLESRDLTLKLSLIKAVTLIARSLLSHHQITPFNFSRKGELLRHMQQLIEAEPPDLLHTPIRQLAMKACAYLVQLHTESNQADTSQLIQTCLMSTFNLVPPELKGSDMDDSTKEISILFNQTMTALQELLKQILLQDLTSEGLQMIFIHLEEWIISRENYKRERAMSTALELLKYYLQAFYVNKSTPLKNLGSLIGELMPRCADPSLAVGQMATDSLHIILTIQLLYESSNLDEHHEDLELLKAVKKQLVNRNNSILFQACCQITEVISKCLPHDQLGNLLFTLFKRLTDQHLSCSSAAVILMKTIMQRRGSELWDQISEIIDFLRASLQCVLYEAVKLSILHSIAILASHNPAKVVSCLLTYLTQITSDKYIRDIWSSLAKERQCAILTMTELLDTLHKQLCSGEKKACSTRESPTQPSVLESLAPVCALYEMITTPESKETVIKLFPQLFSTLLIYHCSFVNVRLPKIFVPHHNSKQREFTAEPQTPSSQDVCVNCVKMLIKLLDQSNHKQVIHFMEEVRGWDQMMDLRKFHRGVMLLAKAMIQYAIPSLSVIVAQLSVFILTVQDCQKVTVAAFFGELLKSPLALQLQFTDILMNRLLRCSLHTSSVVQFLCVRGLGNITSGGPNDIEKYSRPVLCAMTTLMISGENDNEVLMFEVLLCLSKYLEQLRASTIRPFILKIFTGIQPFFEAKCDKVRAEAFYVLGKLAKCATFEMYLVNHSRE
ncbi:maestro heat-like repeat-containing protein family member 1 [Hypanus sabinus]|uniref:maestro heat-like repeat-containing protein family member 1 n=1 Tax=Hypanus sabinus TaxID=79690 RepID=UPI0028C44E2D|nr:maestro heat-like repeat-containing protein family member 1 [Hypanus sabinus]